MNIHEYQAKNVLREYGVNVPNVYVAYYIDEAVANAKNIDEVHTYAKEILGKTLVTHQTGPEGKEVKRLLIEEGCNIDQEYYLGLVLDRNISRIVLMGSEEGGMEIEEVAAESPEKIFK